MTKLKSDLTSSPRHLGLHVFLILAVTAIGSLSWFGSYPRSVSYRGVEDTPPPNGIKVKLKPTTFAVEVRQPFHLQAIADFDPACNRIDAKIPDQRWEQTFTRAELLNGVRAEWNPIRTGTSRMEFFCEGHSLGDIGVSVVIRPASTRQKPPKVKWVLAYGKPIYRDTAFFEIPIMVNSEAQSGSTFVPNTVDRDTYLKVFDHNGQISNISPIVIQRNTAISEPVYLPFPIGADYRLIAYEKEHGQPSNELGLSWTKLAPKLSLVTYPDKVKIYSAAISSSTLRVYLAQDSRQIKPSETTEVLYGAPSVFKSEPPNAVSLSPSNPIGTYRLSAPTESGDWIVNFNEPQLGVSTTAAVAVLPTSKFTVSAIAAGLLGILVARRGGLFKQSGWAVLIELVCEGAAAFLLYGMMLAGWIKIPGTAEYLLSYRAAILVGLIGGYSGLAVFRLGKRIILGPS